MRKVQHLKLMLRRQRKVDGENLGGKNNWFSYKNELLASKTTEGNACFTSSKFDITKKPQTIMAGILCRNKKAFLMLKPLSVLRPIVLGYPTRPNFPNVPSFCRFQTC